MGLEPTTILVVVPIAFTVSREAGLIAESVVACCAPKPPQNVLVIISAVEFDKTLRFLSTCIASVTIKNLLARLARNAELAASHRYLLAFELRNAVSCPYGHTLTKALEAPLKCQKE